MSELIFINAAEPRPVIPSIVAFVEDHIRFLPYLQF